MLVLGIDTSGKTASCALCTEDTVLAQNTFVTKLTHSQVILPMVKRLLSDAGKEMSDVDGFCAVSGPGSYTGLRIGIAAVKAICFGLDKKCAGVSALESLAYNFCGTDSLVCAVMHARQELVYTALFRTSADGTVTRLSDDEITELNVLADRLAGLGEKVICVGDHSSAAAARAESENVCAAQPALNMPLASSLCYAAMNHGFDVPDKLNAEYMQMTKAEKDLLDTKK